ncbi:MAG: DUF2956 family protein [Cellvibrionales bacterium]|nr:DUF2956 family protein [Cellvibrionales bacterium]
MGDRKARKSAATDLSIQEQKWVKRAIREGIDEGIAEFKKQHKAKVREQDKKLKKALAKAEQREQAFIDKSETFAQTSTSSSSKIIKPNLLPWFLLALSWSGFLAYVFL